jgi:AcrR family transcriptional regulator
MSTRGRPRNPDVDEAILDAALRLLGEQGYARLSIDGIAAAAGISRPTLYRRWSSKADLTTAALESRIAGEVLPPGDAATGPALVFLLEQLCERLLQPNSMALVGTLLAEEKQTPELIELFRERVWRRRAETFRRVLERGRAHGEVSADADLEAVIHALIGSIYARYISGQRVPKSWVKRVVATVLGGSAPEDGSRRARSAAASRRRHRRRSRTV